MALKFLELVHFDQGGRVYTYVITLDGQWRFTETGKEFGIDLLSKHTMHSNVNIYIAFSGEFFVRRLRNPKDHPDSDNPDNQATHLADPTGSGAPDHDPPRDPAAYELFIDNDSGTYRPQASLLPILKSFMQKNLPGLKIVTLDCGKDKERMDRLKTQQRDRKKAEGHGRVVLQGSRSSSVSSSDEDDLDELEEAQRREEGPEAEHGHGPGRQGGKSKMSRGLRDLADEPKGRIMAWVQDRESKGENERAGHDSQQQQQEPNEKSHAPP